MPKTYGKSKVSAAAAAKARSRRDKKKKKKRVSVKKFRSDDRTPAEKRAASKAIESRMARPRRFGGGGFGPVNPANIIPAAAPTRTEEQKELDKLSIELKRAQIEREIRRGDAVQDQVLSTDILKAEIAKGMAQLKADVLEATRDDTVGAAAAEASAEQSRRWQDATAAHEEEKAAGSRASAFAEAKTNAVLAAEEVKAADAEVERASKFGRAQHAVDMAVRAAAVENATQAATADAVVEAGVLQAQLQAAKTRRQLVAEQLALKAEEAQGARKIELDDLRANTHRLQAETEFVRAAAQKMQAGQERDELERRLSVLQAQEAEAYRRGAEIVGMAIADTPRDSPRRGFEDDAMSQASTASARAASRNTLARGLQIRAPPPAHTYGGPLGVSPASMTVSDEQRMMSEI